VGLGGVWSVGCGGMEIDGDGDGDGAYRGSVDVVMWLPTVFHISVVPFSFPFPYL